MAFSVSNDYLTGRRPVPTPAEADLVAVRFTLGLAAADLALNTIGAIGILPAGYVPHQIIVDGDDLDSGAGAGVYQVGILNSAGTAFSTAAADGGALASGAQWGDTGTAVATAFRKVLTENQNALATVAPATTDRTIGLKVSTAPSTAVAGTIGVTVIYRAANSSAPY